MITRGTTPTVRFTFSAVSVSEFDVAYLTIKQQGEKLIEKDLSAAETGEKYIEWTLTQEETLSMDEKSNLRIQCRYRIGSQAYASEIFDVNPYDILKEEVI